MMRIVTKQLPDGYTRTVYPFHISIKGLENMILCRDDEDYDIMVKYMAICAQRKNVLIVIYIAVSNHCHVAVLAATQKDAYEFAQELKRLYSMWFNNKYKHTGVLRGVDAQAILLDNNWHVRNALAYIPRNALDNGHSVHEYQWSGFKAMFSTSDSNQGRKVSSLSKREKDAIMHTRDPLNDVQWRIDEHGWLIPASICDSEYLEQVFNKDQSFFLKTIGMLNPAEMEEKLVEAPRRMLPDTDFRKEVQDISIRWFSVDVAELPKEKKYRLIAYVWRTRKTTVSQLARAFELDKEEVKQRLRFSLWPNPKAQVGEV